MICSLLGMLFFAGFGIDFVHGEGPSGVTVRSAPGEGDMVDATRWYNEGVRRAHSGDFQGALTAANIALKIHPNLPAALTLKSEVLLALGMSEEAAAAAELAIEQESDNAVAWNDLASAQNALGHPIEALNASERAISIDPNLAAAYRNLDSARTTIRGTSQTTQKESARASLSWQGITVALATVAILVNVRKIS